MTTEKMDKYNTWQGIDWKTVEREVFKLQKRIYKASQNGDVELVHKLQRLLTKSRNAKLLATRQVTQDNQGKKTAGIDGIKSLKPEQRLEMAKNLKITGKGKPTRRVWIPKPNGEKRPLGIPVMEDRALQALVKLALEPQWEAKFEPNSYGFRPVRGCHDAIEAIFSAISRKSKYVLDADIAKCFDKINHEKLLAKLETYPSMIHQIKAWLKSGVIDEIQWFPTEEGTPQGGVIWPLLANIALHGMENIVREYARTLKGDKVRNEQAISLIRYADDFVIIHENLEVIKQCQEIVSSWLTEIGLELQPSKTKISHTLNEYEGQVGFDFLGFTVRQFPAGKHQSGKNSNGKRLGFKTLIKPSNTKIKLHINKLNEIVREHKSSPQIELIKELNPVIRGWSNYYATVCSKEIFSECGHIVYQQLKRWGERRHPLKNKSWVTNKYWHTVENRKWVFSTKEGDKMYKLANHSDIKIIRHVKVKGDRSIYDGDLIYWSSRLGRHPEMPIEKSTLLKKQKGKCNHCGLIFKDGDLLETDHIIPQVLGGKNYMTNKQLLHRHCHDVKTANDGSNNRKIA